MADRGWRTDPHIQEAKRVCVATRSTAAIVLLLDDNEGTIRLATYGTNGPRCTEAGKLGDAAYAAIMSALEASNG
jgi:hypothetical protein